MIDTDTHGRVCTICINRPEAKNAMNEAMWIATTEAFATAAQDPAVAVVVLTGSGDSFCAGQDIKEMAEIAQGKRAAGFTTLLSQLIDFPKPLLLAVNGLGVGFGATVLGMADLVFMAHSARIRCPFTNLGLAPEMASSSTFTRMLGRQGATWALLSSEWLSAQDCLRLGLAFELCNRDELMDRTMAAAQTLAEKPISSLIASKRTIVEPLRPAMRAAHQLENDVYRDLLGAPANVEAMTAFIERREPNFDGID